MKLDMVNNPYKCWCEWMKYNLKLYDYHSDEYKAEWQAKHLEDKAHHAFLEGRKLPTEEELRVQLESIMFNLIDFSEATQANPPKMPSSWAELAAQALIKFLEERQ